MVFDDKLEVFHIGDATIGRKFNIKRIRKIYITTIQVSKIQLKIRKGKL